jgi:hypothetical protein
MWLLIIGTARKPWWLLFLDRSAGAVSIVTPVRPEVSTVRVEFTDVGRGHTDEGDLAFVWSRVFGRGLGEGWFSPHPHTTVPGGLGGDPNCID